MKKEEMELKEVIKAAILEAFAEMYGVATLDDTDDSAPEDGEGSEGNSNNGNGSNTAANSGGTPNNGRPKPDVGVGTWSMR